MHLKITWKSADHDNMIVYLSSSCTIKCSARLFRTELAFCCTLNLDSVEPCEFFLVDG